MSISVSVAEPRCLRTGRTCRTPHICGVSLAGCQAQMRDEYLDTVREARGGGPQPPHPGAYEDGDGPHVRSRSAPDPTAKPTNPKDMIGSRKVPMHLWPETASVLGAMAFMDGALKYGRCNWRHAGVRASIYVDAARRHIGAWFEGEENDPDSKLPHLAHALACLAILVDAQAAGKLEDDRQTPGGYRTVLEAMTRLVDDVKGRHAGKAPRHFTIVDKPEGGA